METTLVIVTGISLALALGLGLLLWRLLRDERQRADARVAALVDGFAQRSAAEPAPGLASEPPASFASGPAPFAPAANRGDRNMPSADAPIEQVDLSTDTDWLAHFPSTTGEAAAAAPPLAREARLTDDGDDAHAARREAEAARAESGAAHAELLDSPASDFDFDLPRASDSARVLFGQVEDAERANEPNHLMTAGVIAALLVGLVLSIWTVSHLVITMTAAAQQPVATSADAAGAAPAGAGGSASAASAAAGATATAPLELLALHHDQDGSTLTISGLVRNPPNAPRQDRLTAVIFFFNQRGDFLTSARAPLDFRVLAPGDESPFQVSTPAPAGVSRFRVSFRHDEGNIVPHVDRRQSPQG